VGAPAAAPKGESKEAAPAAKADAAPAKPAKAKPDEPARPAEKTQAEMRAAKEATQAADKPAEKEAPKAETRAPAKAPAKADAKEAAKAPAQPAGGKFVVQVAALADAAKARQLQQRVAGTGVKTYTEVVKTAKGNVTRVRAGPFDSREAAEKARVRLKSAGLDGKVVPR
jgi:DedD protein